MQLFFTILLWIAGILLAVLLLLLICPVWVWLALDYDKFTADLQVLGLKFRIYPGKEKPKQQKKKKPQAEQKPKPKAAQKPQKKFEMTFSKLVDMVGAAGSIAKRAIGALKFRDIRVRIPLQGEDAADTALLYGKFSAWFYGSLAALQNGLDMQVEQIELIPDFGGDNKYRLSFSCKIGTCPLIMLGVAIYAFRLLKKERIF